MGVLNFIREALSEKGQPSSKRVMGCISYLSCIVCIAILIVKDGGSSVVRDLLQTLLISATGLLGISAVTNVFKKDGEGND